MSMFKEFGVIDSFTERYSFLSNMYPVAITYKGDAYPSVEHAYQAAKSPNKASRERIRLTKSPYQAKRLGRILVYRENWDEIKFDIMLSLLRLKFNKELLREKLLETGDKVLVEGNTWGDRVWGVYRGKGENRLGKMLMSVREEIVHKRDALLTRSAK